MCVIRMREMRVIESCAACLFDKQQHLTNDPDYLREIREIISNREENDSAPYLVYLFGKVYEKHFGPKKPYAGIKSKYNDLVLSKGRCDQKENRIFRRPAKDIAGLCQSRKLYRLWSNERCEGRRVSETAGSGRTERT